MRRIEKPAAPRSRRHGPCLCWEDPCCIYLCPSYCFVRFRYSFDLAIHILLFHFPIEHRRTVPRSCCPCTQRRDNSVEFQSFGHRCYRIRRCAACRQQHHLEFVFYFSPTCLPLCVAYFVLYRLGLRINTPVSGFVKSQATAAPFPSLLSCVLFVRRPTPVSLLCRSRHSDLLVLVSSSTSPSPTTSALTTAQDTR